MKTLAKCVQVTGMNLAYDVGAVVQEWLFMTEFLSDSAGALFVYHTSDPTQKDLRMVSP